MYERLRNTNCTVMMHALIILSPSLWPGIGCLLLLGKFDLCMDDCSLHSSTHCPGCMVNGSGAMASY